jgi:hypothetical protein
MPPQGWSHPIHIHLVDFQVVRRSGSGRDYVEPYEAAALKDVVYLGRNEEVEVIANFAPWAGVYMVRRYRKASIFSIPLMLMKVPLPQPGPRRP